MKQFYDGHRNICSDIHTNGFLELSLDENQCSHVVNKSVLSCSKQVQALLCTPLCFIEFGTKCSVVFTVNLVRKLTDSCEYFCLVTSVYPSCLRSSRWRIEGMKVDVHIVTRILDGKENLLLHCPQPRTAPMKK